MIRRGKAATISTIIRYCFLVIIYHQLIVISYCHEASYNNPRNGNQLSSTVPQQTQQFQLSENQYIHTQSSKTQVRLIFKFNMRKFYFYYIFPQLNSVL